MYPFSVKPLDKEKAKFTPAGNNLASVLSGQVIYSYAFMHRHYQICKLRLPQLI